jgi:hypothetical protein
MGDSKALAGLLCLALSLAVAPGCSFLRLQLREPGHRNRTFPEAVAKEYHCDKRPLPFFEFEENELLPRKVSPGKEFNQRLVYVMCPHKPTAVVPGKLRTRVLFEGETILEETVQEKLRPGRWVLDSFITLPENADPGLYAMDVKFESRQGNLHARVDFVVKSKKGEKSKE